jgi:hypothetical protein
MKVQEMAKSVETWMRESVDADLLNEAIKDSIVSMWETLVLVNLSERLGGPVTATFAPGSDRVVIVSIADPLVAPVLAYLVQGALAAHTPTVQYTMVDDEGAETLPSPSTVAAALINQVISVASPARAANAVGWNVYVAGVRQNDAPIKFGLAWVEPETGYSLDGNATPIINNTANDIWYIQELTVSTPTGEKVWHEGEPGSEIWNQFSNSLPSNSPYSSFIYEFDGHQLVCRPFQGGGSTVNMIYVRRPRFKPTMDIPFTHPGAEAFIRYNALSLISLTNHEYKSSAGWDVKANAERVAILQSANRKNIRKNRAVKPLFR